MTASSSTEKAAFDQNGRPLGPRALHTRRRLLDATATLLESNGIRDLSVVEIARRADTSPATFYQYFKDAGEATLRLAEEVAAEMPAEAELVRGSWRGKQGLETSRAIAEAFMRHWDAHRSVLLARNLAADEGERRFQKLRSEALRPVLDALAEKIEACHASDAHAGGVHAYAAAAALVSILERLAAYRDELAPLGVTRDDLVETCARILYQTVTGRLAPSSA
jgi:AcrR family transcriptional regulator